MSFRVCLECGETIYGSYHKCYPEWYVWQLDDPERFDQRKVRGYDAQDAVETWAEQEDSYGDYWIVGGGNPIVCVQKVNGCDDAPIEYLAVEGEPVPQYHAEPMTLDSFKRELRSLVRSHRFWEAGRLYGQMLTIDFHTRSESEHE